jgi:nitrous oxide reductase accessory protein NosL
MKKTFLKIFAFALILTSCSNEEIANDNSLQSKDSNLEKAGNLLPSKIEIRSGNEPAVVYNYKYNGNKLASSLEPEGIKIVYQYVGNNITGKTYFEATSNKQIGTEKIYYSSANNPVKRVINFDGGDEYGDYVTTQLYDFSRNDQVVIRSVTRAEGQLPFKTTTIENIVNGNVVKSTFIPEGQKPQTEIYVYDNKKSPFTNVVGDKRFINSEGSPFENKNNAVRFSDEIGSIFFNLTFNNEGFPVKITETGSRDNFVTRIFYN